MVLLFLSNCAGAQQYVPDVRTHDCMWQWGASVRLSVCFFHGLPEVKLGAGCGVGALVFENALFPSAHAEWRLMLNGLGTQASKRRDGHHKTYVLRTDGALAVSLTGKMGRQQDVRAAFNASDWNQPLYYWSDFVPAPLQNPYWNSLTFSKIFVFRTDKKGLKYQEVGFIGLHINQFDVSYYNDGGPILDLPFFGDGQDRWYTGGGMATYHMKQAAGLNFIEGVYHKFSGYNEGAFEYADVLDFAFVPYKDESEHDYSRAQYTFRTGNTGEGWSGFLRIHNPPNRMEIQNLIHYITDNPYHLSPYPKGFSIGGDFSPVFTTYFLK